MYVCVWWRRPRACALRGLVWEKVLLREGEHRMRLLLGLLSAQVPPAACLPACCSCSG